MITVLEVLGIIVLGLVGLGLIATVVALSSSNPKERAAQAPQRPLSPGELEAVRIFRRRAGLAGHAASRERMTLRLADYENQSHTSRSRPGGERSAG